MSEHLLNEPNHADSCGYKYTWGTISTSRDNLNHVIALEMVCEYHQVQWWFPPLPEKVEELDAE